MGRDSRTEAAAAPVSCHRGTQRAPRGTSRYTARPMIKVGGEVDAFCTKCELALAHTVHAVVEGRPVKVECNTCHGVHRYRDGAGRLTARSPAGAERRTRARPEVIPFDDLLATKRAAEARAYSARATYAPDEVVDHPNFGRGFVSAVRDGGKIDVTFRSGVKVLVHARA